MYRYSTIAPSLSREEVVQWAGEALSGIRGMEVYWQNFSVRAPVVSASEVKRSLGH